MSKKGTNLNDLFAEALEAVEKVDIEETQQTQSQMAEFEIEIDLNGADFTPAPQPFDEETQIDPIVDSGDNGAPEDSLDAYIPPQPSSNELMEQLAELEQRNLTLEQKLRKATKGVRKLKGENDRLTQRADLFQREVGHLRMGAQQAARKQELLEERIGSRSEALDLANQRIDELTAAIETLKSRLERVNSLRNKEREEHRKYGASDPLKKLLPALDSLDLAVHHSQSGGDAGEIDSDAILEGVTLAYGQIHNALDQLGVKRISPGAGDPFSATEHDAVSQVSDPSLTPGSIAEMLSVGYSLNDRLIRPARVSVVLEPQADPSEAPAPEAPPSSTDEHETPDPSEKPNNEDCEEQSAESPSADE